MFLNILAEWSGEVKGSSCSTRKAEKSSLAFTTLWSKFAVAKLAPKSVNFLLLSSISTYPLCFEASLCLLKSFSSPYATLKSFLLTVHKAKLSPVRDFWVNRWISRNISFSLTEPALNCPPSFFQCFAFFMVPVLLGNNRKIRFKGGFPLGEMTSDFAAKSRQNYFTTKLCLIFTWITLTRLLKTLSKLRLLLLKTENKD